MLYLLRPFLFSTTNWNRKKDKRKRKSVNIKKETLLLYSNKTLHNYRHAFTKKALIVEPFKNMRFGKKLAWTGTKYPKHNWSWVLWIHRKDFHCWRRCIHRRISRWSKDQLVPQSGNPCRIISAPIVCKCTYCSESDAIPACSALSFQFGTGLL